MLSICSSRTIALLVATLLAALVATPARAQDQHPLAQGGNAVQWEGWSFRWHVLDRQGVVLTNVRYQGRSVLKYAGVAEVFVPYNSGTPRIEDQRHHPFGQNLVPLTQGIDCLPGGTCRALDRSGQPTQRQAAVMLHEEGLAPIYFGDMGKAKAKTLVLWSAYELGDYVYIVQWCFRADGLIMPRVGMTGRLAYFGGDDSNSVVVAPGQRALAHVHNVFFCLDFDVDGWDNTVEEFNYRRTGRSGEQAVTGWTTLPTETTRSLDPASFRSWRVANYDARNAQGYPRSYELVPVGNTGIYRGAGNEAFTQADLWVTRFKDDEVPGQALLADGLPSYVDGERVNGADVVLWYMMSIHHQPRAEDWPAMPISWHEFKIIPRDFLDGSPVKPGR